MVTEELFEVKFLEDMFQDGQRGDAPAIPRRAGPWDRGGEPWLYGGRIGLRVLERLVHGGPSGRSRHDRDAGVCRAALGAVMIAPHGGPSRGRGRQKKIN